MTSKQADNVASEAAKQLRAQRKSKVYPFSDPEFAKRAIKKRWDKKEGDEKGQKSADTTAAAETKD